MHGRIFPVSLATSCLVVAGSCVGAGERLWFRIGTMSFQPVGVYLCLRGDRVVGCGRRGLQRSGSVLGVSFGGPVDAL